jgi:hypothetical protein
MIQKKNVSKNKKKTSKYKINNKNTCIIWNYNCSNNYTQHIQWVKYLSYNYKVFNKIFFYSNTKKNNYKYKLEFIKKEKQNIFSFLSNIFKIKNLVLALYIVKSTKLLLKYFTKILNAFSFCYYFFKQIFINLSFIRLSTVLSYAILTNFNASIILFSIYRLNMFKVLITGKNCLTFFQTKKLFFYPMFNFQLQQIGILFNFWSLKNKNFKKTFSFYYFFRTYCSVQAVTTLNNYFLILRRTNIGNNVFVFYYLYLYYFFTLFFFINSAGLLNYCILKKQKEIHIINKNRVFLLA